MTQKKKKKGTPAKRESLLLTEAELSRCITRIAHEILERNRGALACALVGIRTRGVPFAHRLQSLFEEIEGAKVPLGVLDITLYRDDLQQLQTPVVQKTEIAFPIHNQTVILCDDVLFTGRTVRAALDALMDLGRPRAVQLAVLADRGHRQLPIRPDFVGKNIPSRLEDEVKVELKEVDGRDALLLVHAR